MVAPITVKIDGDASGLNKALGASSKGLSAFAKELGISFPTNPIELAADATKLLARATKNTATAAKDAAAEEKIFNDAMTAATGTSGDYNSSLEDTINQSMKLAFTDTETRKSLAALTTATGDAQTATDLLAGAQDIARLAGVDLETASDAVAKAYAGQDGALRRMIPGLEKGATAQETIANATKLAEGASDSYANSAQATGEKAKIAFGEIQETVGGELIPAMKQLWESIKPLLAQFLQLLNVILPPLLNLFSKFFNVASKVAGAIGQIVNAISKLIQKIKELLGPLTDAVNKLKQIDFNPFKSVGAASATGASVVQMGARLPTGGNSAGGTVTINIYGDPATIEARVIRALRGYQFRNGVGSAFAPQRV